MALQYGAEVALIEMVRSAGRTGGFARPPALSFGSLFIYLFIHSSSHSFIRSFILPKLRSAGGSIEVQAIKSALETLGAAREARGGGGGGGRQACTVATCWQLQRRQLQLRDSTRLVVHVNLIYLDHHCSGRPGEFKVKRNALAVGLSPTNANCSAPT